MARIISVGKDSFWRKFNSLDLFTRLFIVTVILIIIATPFIIYNYQVFNTHGGNQTQRLLDIQQLQQSQGRLRNVFTKSSAISSPSSGNADLVPSNSAKGFNLIDAIHSILVRILQIFN